jgi:D-3-phosphoglycerate dehydrogenase / 2-oxoglutarate reductase
MVTVATLGDNFVLPELFEKALLHRVTEPLDFRSLILPWPQVPFGPVGSVVEASGQEEEVISVLKGAKIAVTQLAPFTRRVFEASPDLKLVSVCRGGPVNVDLEAAAEFTVGVMLAAMRRIGDGNTALHRGEWRGDYYAYPMAGMELQANTVGVIGFGAIGQIVTDIVLAFGAEVLLYDPFLPKGTRLPDAVSHVDLDTLLSRSKVVTLHARLTEDSQNMLTAENLKLLPQGAVLVNTARGGLLDYSALAGLLESGHLGAVALDVFDEEPPPPLWPLLGKENVILTPHLAGATKQTAERAADIVAEDIARFILGKTPQYLANPEVLAQLSLTS